jgi:hypothetical protein
MGGRCVAGTYKAAALVSPTIHIKRPMKRSNGTAFAVILAAFAGITSTLHANLITLESPALGAALHDEDWRPDGGFSSGGAFFNNVVGDFSWSGFALSRETNTTTPGFGNQYSAFAGSGASGSLQYVIGFPDPFGAISMITLPPGESPLSIELTNSTYAALSMQNGDSFAKKFGGPSGNDPDFFKLTISGLDAGNTVVGTVDFYLADFRFANNADDYILNTWTSVDLSTLPVTTQKLQFNLSSSDNGQFGMNTPGYFAADNLTTVPEPGALMLLGLGLAGLVCRRKRA